MYLLLITICVGCVCIVIYFLLKKQAFNGLFKVIGIQDTYIFCSICIP